MKKMAGLWIDHRKAVIVIIADEDEKVIEVKSNVEKQSGRFKGIRSTTPYESQQVQADDSQQRKFTGRLNIYYDTVIARIGNVESILIFGPGEAKGELNKRLERDNLGRRIVGFQIADKMTDHQIVAKVRRYFLNLE
jgi:hypothetical protein